MKFPDFSTFQQNRAQKSSNVIIFIRDLGEGQKGAFSWIFLIFHFPNSAPLGTMVFYWFYKTSGHAGAGMAEKSEFLNFHDFHDFQFFTKIPKGDFVSSRVYIYIYINIREMTRDPPLGF